MNKPDAEIRKAVASVAASSVDGYLRNASRRHRVPTAEGGRGTRRKLAMVTSAVVDTPTAPVVALPGEESTTIGDSDDEWDDVDLPVIAVNIKKQEFVKKDEGADAKFVKSEAGGLPLVKDEAGLSTSKNEEVTIIIDDELDQGPHAAGAVMEGTRPPLIEQPPQTRWRRNDPAYEAMVEQRDLLAAQRKSERIQRTSFDVVQIIALLERGRLLWRESHHPQLLRRLLRVKHTPAVEKNNNNNNNTCGPSSYIFFDAVRKSKDLAQEARSPEHAKPSLAPAWVTCGKDSVKNKTSEAIMTLLAAVNACMELTIVANTGDDDNNNNNTSSASETSIFSDWMAPLQPRCLHEALVAKQKTSAMRVPHSLYFCVVFLALASLSGLTSRLVIAKQIEKKENDTASTGDSAQQQPLQKVSIFPRKTATKRARDAEEMKRSRKMPSSCFWVEVWSAERGAFMSVNPCAACTTLWGSPYTFSIAGDVIMDVTPRYTSKYSSAFAFNRRLGRCNQFSFLWRDKLSWDDSREISEVLLESFSKSTTQATELQLVREKKQLESLTYAESVPITLSALHKHPLFVIESDLAKHEGIFPKDTTTTVGRVKGHMVYKRSAVVNLRSRDGWLREGRSLLSDDETAYKTVAPPASRPFASPSMFYGMWQTKPFEPAGLTDDGALPQHGRTAWYMLLNGAPAPGIVHLLEPQIARVARRMQLDFKLAVLGFIRRPAAEENRRGHWEAQIDGIVVRGVDRAKLLHAYGEWVQLVQEQEAAKRKHRAFHWWLLFSQRMLAMDRLRQQYLQGASLPSL